MVTFFLLISNTNRIPFGSENRNGKLSNHDHIPFTVKGNGNIVFSVRVQRVGVFVISDKVHSPPLDGAAGRQYVRAYRRVRTNVGRSAACVSVSGPVCVYVLCVCDQLTFADNTSVTYYRQRWGCLVYAALWLAQSQFFLHAADGL